MRTINKLVNPKIETLSRGDKKYNDPADGEKGKLFSCEYMNGTILEFRRHNSSVKGSNVKDRFAVKPRYNKGRGESLPILPILYLGLFRLYSYGEFKDDSTIKTLTKSLPEEYLEVLSSLYDEFTGQQVTFSRVNRMGDIKHRADFSSNINGIDSNTISAGEDNLMIILTALVSLRYYYSSIESINEVESILLIDELDASLHPEFQVKLFDKFIEYSKMFKIQIVFTTHSLTLLEYALEKKKNVIYLLDAINRVHLLENIDKYKLNMFLKNVMKKETYVYSEIPVFTEDDQARNFLELLFKSYKENYNINLSAFFHLVQANMSCQVMLAIADDQHLMRSTVRSVFLMDGDQSNDENLNKHLITLPGKESPEKLVFSYSKELFDNDSEIWENGVLINEGLTKKYYNTHILRDIKSINDKITHLRDRGESTKGVEREENKKIFKKYELFWTYIIEYWIKDERHKTEVDEFFKKLNILFLKTADFHNINSKEWLINSKS